jgi:hypothetical protein
LSPSDVTKGFKKAQSAAAACRGWIPGMKIKISATIGSSGNVVAAKVVNGTGTSTEKCVASAVKSNARFVKTEKALTVKTWTYKK